MKISLIMPVYNAEKYISAALDSVLAQDHADWECICVDDGSQDRSGSILDAYAQRDERIRVIHQENGGEGAARNAALPLVTGEYFTCLDADDVLLPGALSASAEALKDGAFDALCCTPLFIEFKNESELSEFSSSLGMVTHVDDRMMLLWGDKGSYGYVSGRIYSRRCFGKVRFPIGMRMCADAWHWMDILAVPARWGTLSRPLIGYRQVPTSASNTINAEFCRCVFKALCHALEVLEGLPPHAYDPVAKFWARHCAGLCHMLRLVFCNWKTFSREDRLSVRAFIDQAVSLAGCNRFPRSYRIRIWSLSSISSAFVLPVVGFVADWFWPRIKRRMCMMESWVLRCGRAQN